MLLPSLGEDVQLGMLYDARTGQLFADSSLWSNDIVNTKQELDDKVQNVEYTYTETIDEARRSIGLNMEGAIALDLGMIKAVGSAKYLNDTKSTSHEARVDVSCTVIRRTRRIPQATLAAMQFDSKFDDDRLTHVVGEVVEGGTATLSFTQPCSSEEEVKNVQGSLKMALKCLPITEVDGDSKLNNSSHENVKVTYSGALIEQVTGIEDARRVAEEMPEKLGEQLNTLSFKLYPLDLLDGSARRHIRALDASLVSDVDAAIKSCRDTLLHLKELQELDVFRQSFPIIKDQIFNMESVFRSTMTNFENIARHLLPRLRDGVTDYDASFNEMRSALALFHQRLGIVCQFIRKKRTEADILTETISLLLTKGFENDLGAAKPPSKVVNGATRLLLSWSGKAISQAHHPLEMKVQASDLGDLSSQDSDDEDDNDEWFESQQSVANILESCNVLLEQKSRCHTNVTFGVTSVEKAYRPGKTKRVKASLGDILLEKEGKLLIVTGMLPQKPTAPSVTVIEQSIKVDWFKDRSEEQDQAIPTTGFKVTFRPMPNREKDGPLSSLAANESTQYISCGPDETRTRIDRTNLGTKLHDDCDYEITLTLETIVGSSVCSDHVIERTKALPSVADQMIRYHQANREILSHAPSPHISWELCDDRGTPTLYLGLTVIATRMCSDPRFQKEVAVRILDVATEFDKATPAADIQDTERTAVAVFAGSSGHGKTTQINAFISFLLGGKPSDSARVMVVDDRLADQSGSVTQCVMCYRIRPFSPLFEGKTLLIVDTPGFGDSRGWRRDAFTTAAMSDFFGTVSHVNGIFFTCRANEARTTFLSPISTYVFSLFAKNIEHCLRTVYTFSDAGSPLAREALRRLRWPVIEHREVEANNAWFTATLDAENKAKVRDWWMMSVKAQDRLKDMILRMGPEPTDSSATLSRKRITLEQRCELVERKILQTADDARSLIAKLDSLAEAVGKAPNEKILVMEKKVFHRDISEGLYTTLCTTCNRTCHEVCGIADDSRKARCVAMSDGKCTVCKDRCRWQDHKNATFVIDVKDVETYVVPDELIQEWNNANNTLEGALLGAMDEYMELQEELRLDITYLADLTAEIKKTAIMHDPAALINYLECLIRTSKARGAPAEQLVQLTTAKNTLILIREVKDRGTRATTESRVLINVLGAVRKEMSKRMVMTASRRQKEESKPCTMYNNLLQTMPEEIKEKAPPLLERGSWRKWRQGALYRENLKAVIKLVKVVLRDGGVVAAIAAQSVNLN
ncbi:hypothetical protein B0I35DRAFT_365004 [Stachybotrys elegans]|uniref:G domain-containing protein n=1 Tax=Stachybotrys elegans TaxID=80388 RepID=A0A8K0SGZ0_9HYPO|nr:hypothetical protein B0I35DRAFT_365004 [Stachybotrys elegans]